MSRAAFMDEVERACAGVEGVTVDQRDGYLSVTIRLAAVPPSLSERSRTLAEAFPAGPAGRLLQVDVRNRQWAAMVLEIVAAIGVS